MPTDPQSLYTLELPTLWSMFLGLVNPWIIGFIVKSDWSSRKKSVIAFGVVFLSSVVGELINGRLLPSQETAISWRGWLSSFLYITILTYSIYTALYKPFKPKSEDLLKSSDAELDGDAVVGSQNTPPQTTQNITITDAVTLLVPLQSDAAQNIINSENAVNNGNGNKKDEAR